MLTGVTVLATGALSLAQAHGRFSTGVGSMLLMYGLVVLLLGVAALRGVPAVRGAVVAAGLLHVIVVASMAANGAPSLWWLELPLVLTLGAALVLIPPPKSSAVSSS